MAQLTKTELWYIKELKLWIELPRGLHKTEVDRRIKEFKEKHAESQPKVWNKNIKFGNHG